MILKLTFAKMHIQTYDYLSDNIYQCIKNLQLNVKDINIFPSHYHKSMLVDRYQLFAQVL